MITTEGKRHIKRYLAGFVPSIGQSLAFGVGREAAALTDSRLEFEVSRTNVTLVSYDFNTDRLIFKAQLPESLIGEVHEVALYSTSDDAIAGQYGSRLLTTFDSLTEDWTGGTFVTANSRLGGDSLNHSPAASGSVTSQLSELYFDLSGNAGADLFTLAANIGSNVSSISIRFMSDAANYYQATISSPAAGYQIIEFAKSSLTVTGNPVWSNINTVEVTTNATAGGSASVDYDGLRIEDVDSINLDYVLVARDVLTIPYIKQSNSVEEIEFSLGVNL